MIPPMKSALHRQSCWLLACLVAVVCVGGTFAREFDSLAQCTATGDTACPPGPVRVYFSSTDCSGAGAYYTYVDEEVLGVCDSRPIRSEIYETTSTYLSFTSVDNLQCNATWSNATYIMTREYYGVCVPLETGKRGAQDESTTQVISSSSMILRNVNATYQAPQNLVVNMTFPAFSPAYLMCPTPTNCTRADGSDPYLINQQAAHSCDIPTSAAGWYDAILDACYRQGDLNYISTSCVDENAYVQRYYTGIGCRRLYKASYTRQVCNPSSPGSSFICNGPFIDPSEPITDVEPTPNEQPGPSMPIPMAPTTSVPLNSTPSPTSASPSLLPSFFFILASALTIVF